MDTLRSMRVFRAVVELDSFVRASERLALSPAMVSKHVMHLERHLGARLLNRSSRHLSLTEIGKVYFEQCRDMLDNLDEVEATVGRTTVVPRGMLRLSAPVWFANAIFTRTLVAYRERFPEVTFDIDLSGRVVNLVEEGFDLALRVSQAPSPTLIARPIGSIAFHLVAAPAYLAQHGTPLLPAELAQHTCLLYKFPSSGKIEAWPLPEWPALHVAGLPALLNCNSVETLLHFAESGLGIAALPDFAVRAALDAGRLHSLLDTHRQHDGALRILWPSSRHLTPKLRAFIDFLAIHVFPQH